MVAAGDVLVCEIVCGVSVSLFRPRFGPILRWFPGKIFKVSNEDFSYLCQFRGLGVIAQGRKSYCILG